MSVNFVKFDVKETVNIVTSSPAFKNWDKNDAYLASLFFLDNLWNVDFYSKTSKKMTSFILDSVVRKKEEQIVFQKEVHDVEELQLSGIKVPLAEALTTIELVKASKAPEEQVTKLIIILQQKKFPLWNITYLTSAFNLLNVKMNAFNKKIEEETFSSVFNFKQNPAKE